MNYSYLFIYLFHLNQIQISWGSHSHAQLILDKKTKYVLNRSSVCAGLQSETEILSQLHSQPCSINQSPGQNIVNKYRNCLVGEDHTHTPNPWPHCCKTSVISQLHRLTYLLVTKLIIFLPFFLFKLLLSLKTLPPIEGRGQQKQLTIRAVLYQLQLIKVVFGEHSIVNK